MMDVLLAEHETQATQDHYGMVHGLAIATVTDNKDPEGLGRVRVRLPWQSESEQTFWAQLAVPMAMANRGFFFLPDVGDVVLVGFELGDMSHPCVIGSLWSGKHRPPESNQDGKNDVRVIKTRENTELRFVDGDKPSVELKLADKKRLFMDKQGITVEDEHRNVITIDSISGTITIESKMQMKLKSKTVSIEASASIEIKAGATLTLKGALVQIN